MAATKKKELTGRQWSFCDLYVRYSDPVRAYVEAYDAKDKPRRFAYATAKDMLAKPHIQHAIEEMRRDLRHAMRISREQHVLALKELADGAARDKKWAAAVKAQTEIGKCLGYGEKTVVHKHELTVEQARQRIERIAAQHPGLVEKIPGFGKFGKLVQADLAPALAGGDEAEEDDIDF